MSCMIHVYVLEPGWLNEDRKTQQHHLSKISWRRPWEGGDGGGREWGVDVVMQMFPHPAAAHQLCQHLQLLSGL